MQTTPRSQAKDLYTMRYEVQTKTEKGGWVVSIATNDEQMAIDFADHLVEKGRDFAVRVIDNAS